MAKGIYVGVNGVARKVKKIYVGVNNVARKVKKIYVGVNGVARLTYSSGLSYSGYATSMTSGRRNFAGASTGDYAIFMGGTTSTSNTPVNTVDAYSPSLVRSSAQGLSFSPRYSIGTSTTSYGINCGGNDTGGVKRYEVDAYNGNLVKNTTSLGFSMENGASATLGGKGFAYGGTYSTSGHVFNDNLTYSYLNGSSNRSWLMGGSNGVYAVFAGGSSFYGGTGNYTKLATVDAFDFNLTRKTAASLSVTREQGGGARCGNYVAFAGGSSSGSSSNIVEAYDVSLVKTTPAALTTARLDLAGQGSVEGAIFPGGFGDGSSTAVDVYDASLVRTETLRLATGRRGHVANWANDKILVAGGQEIANYAVISSVEVFA